MDRSVEDEVKEDEKPETKVQKIRRRQMIGCEGKQTKKKKSRRIIAISVNHSKAGCVRDTCVHMIVTHQPTLRGQIFLNHFQKK